MKYGEGYDPWAERQRIQAKFQADAKADVKTEANGQASLVVAGNGEENGTS